MGADFCEPGLAGILVYGLLYAVLGGALGWLGGMAVRRLAGPNSAPQGRHRAGGCLGLIVTGLVATRLLLAPLYGSCEAAAWGMAPGGAMLAFVVVPLAGLAGFIVSARAGQ